MPTKKYLVKFQETGGKKVAGQTNAVAGGLKRLAVQAVAAGGAFFAAQGIIRAFKSTIELAGIQEKAEKRLQVALGKTSNALLSQARALQQVTTFGDEAIIGVQASIAAFVKSEEQIKLATKATLDMAVAMGMDLKSAGDLIAKTLGSSTNALTRYGVEVEGAVGSTERLTSLTDGIARLWGGQAAAAAETMTGSLEQMHNALGDAGEVIGSLLAPAITNIAVFLKDAAIGVGEFFRSLTETDLEKTIRQLKDIGVNGQILIDLEEIQLKRTLADVNSELEKAGIHFSSINSAQDPIKTNIEAINAEYITQAILAKELETSRGVEADDINDIAASRRGISKGMADMIGLQARLTEDINRDIEASKNRVIKWQDENDAILDNIDILKRKFNLEQQLAILTGKDVLLDRVEPIKEENKLIGITIEKVKEKNKEIKNTGLIEQKTFATSLSGLRSTIKGYLAQAAARMIAAEASKGLVGILTATAGAIAISELFDKFVPQFAKGGDFITSGPQMVMVGDNPGGKERVQVTPLSSPNVNGPSGGMTLNFYGPTDDEYVRDTVIPAIQKATRYGMA